MRSSLRKFIVRVVEGELERQLGRRQRCKIELIRRPLRIGSYRRAPRKKNSRFPSSYNAHCALLMGVRSTGDRIQSEPSHRAEEKSLTRATTKTSETFTDLEAVSEHEQLLLAHFTAETVAVYTYGGMLSERGWIVLSYCKWGERQAPAWNILSFTPAAVRHACWNARSYFVSSDKANIKNKSRLFDLRSSISNRA